MAYVAGPDGTDTIAASDNLIKANFAHIVSAFDAEHVWDATTAANCIHNPTLFKFKLGTITRALDAVGAAVDTTGIGFVPQIAFFHVLYSGDDVRLYNSTGSSDGTNHSCVFNITTSIATTTYNSNSYCIYLTESNIGSTYQRATCAFASDKFTLTWTTLGMTQTETAKILYLCLRFSA